MSNEWYDETIERKIFGEIISRYTKEELLNLNLSKLSFKELRKIATAISVIGYTQYSSFYSLNCHERKDIIKKLNEEFNNRLGDDVLEEYEKLYTIARKDSWSDDIRYTTLAYNNKGYEQIKALKNLVWFLDLKYIGVNLNVALQCNTIFTNGLSYNFGYEKMFNLNLNFEERNENRKLETDAQNKFVDFVFNKQYKKAYEMIEKEVNLYKN